MKKFSTLFFWAVIVIIVAVHLYAYRVWIFSPGVLTQGDWILSLANYSKTLLTPPIIWKSYLIGSMDLTPPFYPFLLLEGILSNLGVSYAYIERITFMWPIAFLTLPLSFLLIKSYTKSRLAAIIGSLVYTYNTYFFIIQSGHLTLMAAFTLAPLALLWFIKSIEKRSLFYSVLTGIICFVMSFYEFRALYLFALVAALYYGYFIFVISKKSIQECLQSTIVYAGLPLLIIGLLNIYWILPVIFSTVSITNTVFSESLFGGEMFNVSRAIALFHPFWTGGEYFPFIVQPIPFYFFFLPIFAFLGIYVARKNKRILFYGLLALLGVFLTKENNPPFPDVYFWLFTNVPGFQAFREASKFYFIIALGYSVLIGAFFDYIWTEWEKGKLSILKYILTIVIIFISLLNTRPLVMGDFATLFVPRTMSPQYAKLNTFLDSQNVFFRTLWVPEDSRWGTNTNIHPKLGVGNVLTSTWKNFSDPTKYTSLGSQYIDFLGKDFAPRLFDSTSIKYVIVPLADTPNDDNFYIFFNKSKEEYIQALDKIPSLKKIDLGLKDVIVYENSSFAPHIYATESKDFIHSDVTVKNIKSSSVNESEYKIILSNIFQPLYINFTDSYHPDWKIRVGDFHWLNVLGNKNYFLPSSEHFKNEANLNSFYINPKEICENGNIIINGCVKNSDGSYTISLTMYFVPQVYSNLGTIISSIFLAVLIAYFVFIARNKYAKNH